MTDAAKFRSPNTAVGWQSKRIGDICDIRSGGTPSKSDSALWSGSIPWVSGKDLKRPKLFDSIDHISPEGLASGSRLAPANAVLVLVRGMGLAKDLPVAVAMRPMAFNQDIKALIHRAGLSGSFLRSAIYHAKEQLLSRIVPSAHGTLTLNLDDIENLRLLVPDDAFEAHRIAQVLDLALALVESERNLLSVCLAVKASAMRAIFENGLRGGARKLTDVGYMPADWTNSSLGELCDDGVGRIQTGPFGSQLHAREYELAGVPVVNPTHLFGNRINHDFVPRISEERAISLERHKLKAGDILFARRGEIGRIGLVGREEDGWLCGTGCFLVRVDSAAVYNPFLAHFFAVEGVVAWLSANAAGAIMPNLNNLVLGRLPVLLPGIDEQRKIVEILNAIDRKIDLHKRKRIVLEKLFNALLHKLMTGEIRVADLDLSALENQVAAGAAA